MTGQDNPFGALDKLLFSPTQAKPKAEKQMDDEVKTKSEQVPPFPSSLQKGKSTTQSPTARLQSRKAAKVQDRESAKPQSRKIAKVRHSETAKPQMCEAANVQNRKTAKVREPIRKSINHGLSIYEDQLFSLKEFQLKRQKALGKKYSLGDLAKEALDVFISNECKQG